MELREALTRITEIRMQMARSETFRGYRALPVAGSGLLAGSGARGEALFSPEPMRQLEAYLALWVGAAVVSMGVVTAVIVWTYRRSDDSWSREITWLALEQFLPCLVAGGLVTLVLYVTAPEIAWLLPGLWS